MDAAITYITAAALERFVTDRVAERPGVDTVLLCCAPVNDIDATGVEALSSLSHNLARQNIALKLCTVKKQVREVLDRSGLHAQLGDGAFYPTDLAAINALADISASASPPPP